MELISRTMLDLQYQEQEFQSEFTNSEPFFSTSNFNKWINLSCQKDSHPHWFLDSIYPTNVGSVSIKKMQQYHGCQRSMNNMKNVNEQLLLFVLSHQLRDCHQQDKCLVRWKDLQHEQVKTIALFRLFFLVDVNHQEERRQIQLAGWFQSINRLHQWIVYLRHVRVIASKQAKVNPMMNMSDHFLTFLAEKLRWFREWLNNNHLFKFFSFSHE